MKLPYYIIIYSQYNQLWLLLNEKDYSFTQYALLRL